MATIEIDGKTLEVENGKMIIEAADEADIYIPRFCYHKKLSVAANCRMCLVEIENVKKPVPACATPIANGMKVFTKSEEAIRSQKAVMEFLLINHPLDCPICDQGGECELQDISMGYGAASSEYDESKRSVVDDNLGPLIATEMTRCIHCTRCVRFGEEIAGLRELGATNRGEKMQIGTYVEHSMTSEISGNIIDLCPVGALTSKPYRFTARPWELSQREGIAPHDCLGSHIYFHVMRHKVMRVVPKEHEAINETWLSDRDRFSYLGLNSANRATHPMIKKEGQWHVVDWETALKYAADGMAKVIKHHGPEQFAAFASASSTTEEFYILQKLMRALGVQNLDHRLHQIDFRDQDVLPVMPSNDIAYAAIEQQETILLLGCAIHREVPLAGVRVRKAYRAGAKILAINPVDYEYHFPLATNVVAPPQEIPMQLAMLIAAMVDEPETLSDEVRGLLFGLPKDAQITAMAHRLKTTQSTIICGAFCDNHPDASLIRGLLHVLKTHGNISIVQLTTGANTAGGWLAGMLPHREASGKALEENAGMPAYQAIQAKLRGYLLHGVEPIDFADSYQARQAMLAAEFVVLVSAFQHESMQDYADVILPYAPYAETSGTYINIDHQWQTFKGAIAPHGEARPAWKIFRVLGNLLGCKAFDYVSSAEILAEVRALAEPIPQISYKLVLPENLPDFTDKLYRVGEWPLYRVDALVRHAEALQNCAANDRAVIKMHPLTAKKFKLSEVATVSQGHIEITLPLEQDERIPENVVWLQNAMPETSDLGCALSPVTIKR